MPIFTLCGSFVARMCHYRTFIFMLFSRYFERDNSMFKISSCIIRSTCYNVHIYLFIFSFWTRSFLLVSSLLLNSNNKRCKQLWFGGRLWIVWDYSAGIFMRTTRWHSGSWRRRWIFLLGPATISWRKVWTRSFFLLIRWTDLIPY